jgi:hypothetical protein
MSTCGLVSRTRVREVGGPIEPKGANRLAQSKSGCHHRQSSGGERHLAAKSRGAGGCVFCSSQELLTYEPHSRIQREDPYATAVVQKMLIARKELVEASIRVHVEQNHSASKMRLKLARKVGKTVSTRERVRVEDEDVCPRPQAQRGVHACGLGGHQVLQRTMSVRKREMQVHADHKRGFVDKSGSLDGVPVERASAHGATR